MNVGTFAFILNMEKDGKPVTEIASLGLYSRVEPARAAALAVLMFSLAGIPPLVGFFGKFYVLKAAVDAGLVWLAVAGVIASVIGAYYYLRIVYLMYFGAPVAGWTADAAAALGAARGLGAGDGAGGGEPVRGGDPRGLGRRDPRALTVAWPEGTGREVLRRARQHQRRGAAPGGRGRDGAAVDPRGGADGGARADAAGPGRRPGQLRRHAADAPGRAAGGGGAALVRRGARAL